MAECFGKLNTVFACSVEAFLAHKTQMVHFNKASKSSIHSSLLKQLDAGKEKQGKENSCQGCFRSSAHCFFNVLKGRNWAEVVVLFTVQY